MARNLLDLVPAERRAMWRDRADKGNVAVIFALSLPMVVAAGGFGVETTYWYLRKHQLQSAADAAAHTGAIEKRTGSNTAKVIAVATKTATENGFKDAIDDIQVHSPPVSGPSAGQDAVEVVITSSAQRLFTRLFNTNDVGLRARAVARYSTAANACVLALHPTGYRAITFSGGAQVTLLGCSIMANSTNDDAVYGGGTSKLRAQCIISGGGTDLTPGTYKLDGCAAPITEAPPVADPYKDVPIPTSTEPCQEAVPVGGILKPGTYCGIKYNGDITFDPGVYIIDDLPFSVQAGSVLQGDGVTFFFRGNATFQGRGTSTINFSAPTSDDDPYKGILMFGNRSTSSLDTTINGTAGSSLTGALYFPTQRLSFNGDFSGTDNCVQVIARTVNWGGHVTINANCEGEDLDGIPVYSLVKLTE